MVNSQDRKLLGSSSQRNRRKAVSSVSWSRSSERSRSPVSRYSLANTKREVRRTSSSNAARSPTWAFRTRAISLSIMLIRKTILDGLARARKKKIATKRHKGPKGQKRHQKSYLSFLSLMSFQNSMRRRERAPRRRGKTTAAAPKTSPKASPILTHQAV